MEVICKRFYGEPKLKLPDFCNKGNFIKGIPFNKHCTNKLWKHKNNYYILFRDWFSSFISFDKAIELGIIEKRKMKFCYDDNFGSVVLRNEALVKFNRDDWYSPTTSTVNNLCINLARCNNFNDYELVHADYTNFFEKVLKAIEISPFDTEIQLVGSPFKEYHCNFR